MKITAYDFRVRPGDAVKLTAWPTRVPRFCTSKKQYHRFLDDQVCRITSYLRP